MFETICTLPLTSELFAQAIHPSEPILAVGLSSGHVQSFRLPSAPSNSDDEDGNASILSTGTSTIDTEWRTRRHQGSCRSLAFSTDGDVLYSAGTDSLIKAASSNSGRVISKVAIPRSSHSLLDPPTLLHALSPQTLLLATDSSSLHIYDLRTGGIFSSPKPNETHHPHEDYVSSLTPLRPTEASTSGYSKLWVTTGGSTLAVTDLRRGVLVKSEDQEEELLSSAFVSGLPAKPGRSVGEKILVGSGSGVLTLWERGVWDDQDERIIVDAGIGGGESLDVVVVVPERVGKGRKNVAVGLGDGTVRFVKLGPNRVGEVLKHDEVEGVVGLGFDIEGRMISGGGSVVKVWQEGVDAEDREEEDESDEDETAAVKRKMVDRGSDDDSDAKEDSSEEEEKPKKKKKGKRNKKAKNGGNGVLGLKGLD